MYFIASQKLGFLNLTKMKILQADSVHHGTNFMRGMR